MPSGGLARGRNSAHHLPVGVEDVDHNVRNAGQVVLDKMAGRVDPRAHRPARKRIRQRRICHHRDVGHRLDVVGGGCRWRGKAVYRRGHGDSAGCKLRANGDHRLAAFDVKFRIKRSVIPVPLSRRYKLVAPAAVGGWSGNVPGDFPGVGWTPVAVCVNNGGKNESDVRSVGGNVERFAVGFGRVLFLGEHDMIRRARRHLLVGAYHVSVRVKTFGLERAGLECDVGERALERFLRGCVAHIGDAA